MGRIVPALIVMLVVTGCGYTTSRIDDFPRSRTIAVVPFENTGFRRDLELRLTNAVVAEIRRRTNLALATPQTADLVLEGRMTAREQVLVQDRDRIPIQKLLSGSLQVELKDRHTGQVIRTDLVNTAAQYRLSVPSDPAFGDVYGESLRGSATDEWARRMAVRIVQILERGF